MTLEMIAQIFVYPIIVAVVVMQLKNHRCLGSIETEIKYIKEALNKLVGG